MATKKTTAAAEKPAAAKKTTNAKTEKTAKAAPKTAAKKAAPAAKKAAAASREVTKIQFDGCEFDVAEIVEKAKADYKANNKSALKSIDVYIKPEEKTAYYVANGKVEGKVEL